MITKINKRRVFFVCQVLIFATALFILSPWQHYGYHDLKILDNITSIEWTFGVTYILCKIDNILGRNEAICASIFLSSQKSVPLYTSCTNNYLKDSVYAVKKYTTSFTPYPNLWSPTTGTLAGLYFSRLPRLLV